MKCQFEQLETGRVRCVVCGREVNTPNPPERVNAQCRLQTAGQLPTIVSGPVAETKSPCPCNDTPSIGVVIPSYNCGEFLERCIASWQAQTLKPTRVIIVDDGSTDNTREVLTRLGLVPAAQSPGLLTRGQNYAAALLRRLRGRRVQPEEITAARLQICNGCDSLDPISQACRECGCPIGEKAAWPTEECPRGFWSGGFPIEIISHEINRGANAARQTGLDQLDTEWVVLADADAVYEPEYLARLHAAAQNHPAADLVYCSWVREQTETGRREVIQAKPWDVRALWACNFISMCSLVRRAKLPRLDSESPIDDWEAWMQIADAGGKGVPVDAILFTGYERPEGKTAYLRTNREAAQKAKRDIQQRYRHLAGPTRVLFLLADLSQGGVGTYHLNLFRSLLGNDVEASTLVFHYVTDHTDWRLIRELRRYTRIVCTSTTASASLRAQHPEIDWTTDPKIYDRLLDECDVVTTAVNDPHVMRRTDWRGKPLIAQLHSTCDVTKMIAQTLSPYARKFVVTSQEARNVAVERFGINPERIVVIELAVDANRVACWRDRHEIRQELAPGREHDRWVMFFGRYSPEKRIERIAEAVGVLNRSSHRNCWLGVFAGSGWKERDIRPQIIEAIPDDHLLIPWGPIGEILRAADVFVCASAYEGGPTSSLEALVAGVPIASTDVGILSGIDPKPYASLGRDPSPAQIADTLRQMDIAPRWELVHELAGRFNIGRKAEEWKHLIESVR